MIGLALASNTTTSSLSATFVSTLLISPSLPSLLKLNSTRLGKAYTTLTSFFHKHNIPYIPAYAGIYVFAKLAPKAAEWEDENNVVAKLKEAGVLVSAGKNYHGPEAEKGWCRVGFAVETEVLDEAIRRMDNVFAAQQYVKKIAAIIFACEELSKAGIALCSTLRPLCLALPPPPRPRAPP